MLKFTKVRKLSTFRELSPYTGHYKTPVLPINKGFFKIGCGKFWQKSTKIRQKLCAICPIK